MSFTETQLKHIKDIQQAFSELRKISDNLEGDATLHLGKIDKDTGCGGDSIAFIDLYIKSGNERIVLTDTDLIFTDETEQQSIFDYIKEQLEENEQEQANENAT